MSKLQIIAELPKLSREERREIAKAVFELEDDAEVLKHCDRMAEEHFLMLDALEAEDGSPKSS